MEIPAQRIQELSDKVVSDFLETIDVLASIVAAAERGYESSHCRFISEKSAELAQNLGMNDGEVFEVKVAGLLHDIGKVSIPEHIRTKFSSEMSEEEFTLYARHPELGYEILSQHSGLGSIAEIVQQHHERLDGSGFPRHLRGADIHPGASIIHVVDVYHNALFKRNSHRFQQRETSNVMTSTSGFLHATHNRYSQVMNHLSRKAKVLFREDVVETFVATMEAERKVLGNKVVKRVSINQLKPGMELAEDYSTTYGLLVATRGQVLTPETIDTINRFSDLGEIPRKLLIVD